MTEEGALVSSHRGSSDFLFERQTLDDLEEAYALLAARVAQLIEKKTGQYVAPYPPIDEYRARTERGQNWLLRSAREPVGPILGIVSLIPNGGAGDWPLVRFPDQYLWISSLFVGVSGKHQGLGRVILDKARIEAPVSMKSLWLDCYLDSGFLEGYYRHQGFRTVSTQRFTYGDRTFGAALMCKEC